MVYKQERRVPNAIVMKVKKEIEVVTKGRVQVVIDIKEAGFDVGTLLRFISDNQDLISSAVTIADRIYSEYKESQRKNQEEKYE